MAKKKRVKDVHKIVFVVLALIVLILGVLNVFKAKGWLLPQAGEIDIEDGVVDLDSMTLEQKIGQMVIVAGFRDNYVPWRNMQVGGIHLFARQNEHIFNNTIIDFQYEMQIPFFVTSDLEGCVTPFAHVQNFSSASEIETIGEAFEKGFREGEFLNRLGFNLNFAPVVDLEDNIWKCRSFPGTEQNVSEKAQAYILGLQNHGVIATAKHYPGKTLIGGDPHKVLVAANIEDEDLFPYEYLVERGDVKAIMVTHVISSGKVDSQGLPAVVSREAVDEIKKDYDGLIISDEIHMLGLKNYFATLDEMYIAVFGAGNDIILNFDKDPNEIHRMILVIKKAVEDDIISEEEIDKSVTKILQAKGFEVS